MENNFSAEDLPEGPLSRYIRDIHTISKSDMPFSDFKKQWEVDYNNECEKRDRDHPVELDKKVQLTDSHYVRFFKRKGEGWSCLDCDTTPYGAAGKISLEEALKKCGIKDVSEI
jgi:hypothetical protein